MGKVAKLLGMSQSNISLSIKSLENKLGEKLFDRIGKKLILNERGREFKRITISHFLGIKEAKSIFSKTKISGLLKISGSRTVGDYILPQIVFDFVHRYNEVKISSFTDNSNNIVQKILNGNIDIGFIESNIKNDEIYRELLKKDELIVVCNDASLKDREFFIDELFYKTWLIREEGSGTRELFLNQLGGLSKEMKKILVLSSFESIKNILLNNKNAITCISKVCIENELKNNLLFEVKIKNISFDREFYLIYHKNRYKSILFSTFIDFTKSYFIDN